MYTVNSDYYAMEHTEDRIIESTQFARCESENERRDYDDERYAAEVAWPY